MKVVTAEQMREIDRVTIEERGVPGVQLMEKAGESVAREILQCFDAGVTVILAGKGNNAGDGFVVARHLHQREWPVRVLLLGDPGDLRGDARKMFDDVPPEVRQLRIEDAGQLDEALADAEVIVDAILGTGIKGAVRGLFGEAIEAVNALKRPVVAVDIPSGLTADGGPIEGPVIRAAFTVTMGLPKLGMLIHPGIEYTGNVIVASLDFPDELLTDPNLKVDLLTESSINALLPYRPTDGHKGTFGSLMVVGGAPGMTGAPILASRAAMRSGTGLVYCATAAELQPLILPRLLEELTLALPSECGACLGMESLGPLLERAPQMRAVALGPGIGQASETQRFVRKAVEMVQRPMVIDADGLNALGGHLDILRTRTASTILTPHPGEMSRLTGLSTAQIQRDRIEVARKLAMDFSVVVVLKGAQTIVADENGSAFINPTGNTGLAKGGSGDVLTGLIGGLLAQGLEALPAAQCGVFIHGLAADLAADTIPPRAMISSDVIAHIGRAFNAVAEAGR